MKEKIWRIECDLPITDKGIARALAQHYGGAFMVEELSPEEECKCEEPYFYCDTSERGITCGKCKKPAPANIKREFVEPPKFCYAPMKPPQEGLPEEIICSKPPFGEGDIHFSFTRLEKLYNNLIRYLKKQ